LAEKGFWENMGPRDLIDGGALSNYSVAWWDDQHFKQGVRTDSDLKEGESDLKRTTTKGVGGVEQRRRRLKQGQYQEEGGTAVNDDHDDDKDNNNDNDNDNNNDNDNDNNDNDNDNNDNDNNNNNTQHRRLKAATALTEGERIIIAAREKDLAQRSSRLGITRLLRKRFFVEEAVTRNAFQSADIDGSGFLESTRSRRSACDTYPKNVRRMLKLPVYVNEDDGSQVWCRKTCPEVSAEDEVNVCDCDSCRLWERTEYTELAARYIATTYFIPDVMHNTRKSTVTVGDAEGT
jgi:hypothetical protein